MTSGRVVRWIFLLIALELAVSAGLALAHTLRTSDERRTDEANRTTAVALALISLSLWPEPLYCRHPAETAPFAAFSDHPSALEHFPAGSFVPPATARSGTGPPHRIGETKP